MKGLFYKNPFLVLVMLMMISAASCRKPCKDVTCENGGTTREEGKECVCDCAAGYEGDRCQDLVRERYMYNWSGSEACGNGSTVTYFIAFTNADASDEMELVNIGDFGSDHVLIAKVNGNEFTIASQQTGGKTFEGSGSLADNTITLEYTVSQGGASYSCSGTFEKFE